MFGKPRHVFDFFLSARAAATNGRSVGLSLVGVLVLAAFGGGLCRAAEDEIPEPEKITLETKDSVNLKCMWYAGTKGKSSVPIIMVHGLGGKKEDFNALALYLQAAGNAVIVPDLRGHGGSIKYKGVAEPFKKYDELKGAEYDAVMRAMIKFDIERCKKFLMEKHNEGELNIDMLCVIGAQEGAVLATNWAESDWNWAPIGDRKQGQDVKALILLSPEDTIKKTKVRMLEALKYPPIAGTTAPRISIMIAVGQQDNGAFREAKKMHEQLEKVRGKVKPEDRAKLQDLVLDAYPTSLQGVALLDPKNKLGLEGLSIGDRIRIFIQRRLVDRQADFKWEERQQAAN